MNPTEEFEAKLKQMGEICKIRLEEIQAISKETQRIANIMGVSASDAASALAGILQVSICRNIGYSTDEIRTAYCMSRQRTSGKFRNMQRAQMRKQKFRAISA